jgi:hypothetical protein
LLWVRHARAQVKRREIGDKRAYTCDVTGANWSCIRVNEIEERRDIAKRLDEKTAKTVRRNRSEPGKEQADRQRNVASP